MIRLLTQGEIETSIMDLSHALAEETERYSIVSDEAVHAEATYRYKSASAWLAVAASGEKMTAAERDRRIDIHCATEFETWKILEARRAACREALLSYRARLDALRTLSANVRHQT